MKDGDFDSDSADTYSVVSTYSHFSEGFTDFYQNNGNAVTTPVSIEKCRMSFMDSAVASRDDLESLVEMPHQVRPKGYPTLLIESPVLENSTTSLQKNYPALDDISRLEEGDTIAENAPAFLWDENNNCDRPSSISSIPEELKIQIDSLKIDYEYLPFSLITKERMSPRVQDASVNTSEDSFQSQNSGSSKSDKYVEVVPSGKRICIYILGFDLSDRHELDNVIKEIKRLLEEKYLDPSELELVSLRNDEILRTEASKVFGPSVEVNDWKDDFFDCPVAVSNEEKLISLPPVHATASHTPRTPKSKQKHLCQEDKAPNVSFDKMGLNASKLDEATILWNKITQDLQHQTGSKHSNRKETDDVPSEKDKRQHRHSSDEKSPFGFLQKVISARINSVISNSVTRDNHSGFFSKESNSEAMPKLSNNFLYKLCLNSVKKGHSDKESGRHLSERKHGHRFEGNNYLKRKPLPNIPSPSRESYAKNGPIHLHRRSASKADYLSRSSRMNDTRCRSFESTYRYGNQKYDSFSYGRPSTTQEHVIPQKFGSTRCKFNRPNGGYLRATSAVEAVDSDRRWRP